MKKNRSKSKAIENKKENIKSNELIDMFPPNKATNHEPILENTNIIND